MPTIGELTKEEFETLLDEYFAVPEKRSQMTMNEIKELATSLNEKINVPLITEETEESIIVKVVVKVDNFLYDNLPNEVYDLVRSMDKGIDDAEANRLIVRLSKLANEYINIPYIPESAEYIAIKYIIGVIINSARDGWDFEKAKNATDEELDAVVAKDPVSEK